VLRRLVGGASAVAITLVVAILGTVAVRDFVDRDVRGYCVDFASAIGVFEGSTVSRMGVPVGRVDRIMQRPGGVTATFRLDAEAPHIPRSVRAVTRSASILADRAIELVGTDPAPDLKPGECISVDRTATPKALSELTESLQGLLAEVQSQPGTSGVADLAEAVNRQLSPTAIRTVRQAMTNLGEAAPGAGPMIVDTFRVIDNIAPTLVSMDREWGAVEATLANLPTVLRSLGDVVFPAVKEMFAGIPAAVDLSADIQLRYGDQLWSFLGKLPAALRLAATRSQDVDRLAALLPPFAAAVAKAITNASGGPIPIRPPQVRTDRSEACSRPDMKDVCVQGSDGTVDVDLLRLILKAANK